MTPSQYSPNTQSMIIFSMVDVCSWLMMGLDFEADSNLGVDWSKEMEGIYFPHTPPLICQGFPDKIYLSTCLAWVFNLLIRLACEDKFSSLFALYSFVFLAATASTPPILPPPAKYLCRRSFPFHCFLLFSLPPTSHIKIVLVPLVRVALVVTLGSALVNTSPHLLSHLRATATVLAASIVAPLLFSSS